MDSNQIEDPFEQKSMRLNYYQFPEDAPEDVLLSNGCAVILKDGGEIYADSIPNEKRDLVDRIDRSVGGISVTEVKRLIREYGGYGWTEHIDRDGSAFEITPITLAGNNSKFRYNHHL